MIVHVGKLSAFVLLSIFIGGTAKCQVHDRLPIVPGVYRMPDEEFKRIQEQTQLKLMHQDPFFMEILSVAVDFPDFNSGLEILEGQKKKIDAAIAELEREKVRIEKEISNIDDATKRKFEYSQRMAKPKAQYNSVVTSSLLPQQVLKLFISPTNQIGLQNRLKYSFLGNWLELSDDQHLKLEEHANKATAEMLEALSKYRRDAYDSIIDILTDKQEKMFFEYFDKQKVAEHFGTLQFEQLIWHYAITTDASKLESKGGERLNLPKSDVLAR